MTKKRKRRRRFGVYEVYPAMIVLECRCGNRREIERTDEDTDDILDREASGWYTLLPGIAMCPRCRMAKGKFKTEHIGERIHGEDQDHLRMVA